MVENDAHADIRIQIREALASHTSLNILGGGSKSFLGGENRPEATLDMTQHAGIIAYEPSELVMTVRGGTPLKDVVALLAENDQELGFEPPRFDNKTTIGGVVASGIAGPARPFKGGVRDAVLGATMINGRAEILEFGGQVMKNVAGYDISRLLAGSLGILGPILSVSLRVSPRPESTELIRIPMSQAEAIDEFKQLRRQYLPLTGAVWFNGKLRLRLAGNASAVDQAKAKLGGDAGRPEFWKGISDFSHPFFDADQPLWRISVPSDSPELILPGAQWVDWGGAQRWLLSEQAAGSIRKPIKACGGHATLFRAHQPSRITKEVFQAPSEAIFTLHKKLKEAFDPAGVFNPGRLYSEI